MFSWLESICTYTPLCIRCVALVYAAIPMVIQIWPTIIRHVAFLNFLCLPLSYLKLNEPKNAWKMDGVINTYIESESGIHLGIWHFSPLNLTDATLLNAKKVVIYCHGNAFHRGEGHRRNLYHLLQNLGFHVITFDYRGFGDSAGTPSEAGVITDTIAVYKWTVNQIENQECQVLVWGHSLGTTVSTQALLKLQEEEFSKLPDGLILEAPFTKLLEVMFEYPISKVIIYLYPKWLILNRIKDAVQKNHLEFNTIDCLPKLKLDVLILHAKDDIKIPHQFGEKLFKRLKSGSQCRSSKFISFEGIHRHGHNNCWNNPEFARLVSEFSESVRNKVVQRFTAISI